MTNEEMNEDVEELGRNDNEILNKSKPTYKDAFFGSCCGKERMKVFQEGKSAIWLLIIVKLEFLLKSCYLFLSNCCPKTIFDCFRFFFGLVRGKLLENSIDADSSMDSLLELVDHLFFILFSDFLLIFIFAFEKLENSRLWIFR